MGNELFGVDIAGIIHDNVSEGVLPATLRRRVERGDTDDLTAAPRSINYDHPCRGFTESLSVQDLRKVEALADDRKVTIIGGSLPLGIIPEKGDQLTIEDNGEDVKFLVLSLLDRDPAAATYSLHVRR